MNNSTAYNYVNKIRENTNQNKWLEGGVAIGIDKSLTYRDLSALIPEAIQCFERVLILTVH
jgi:hypothetical protein